MEDFWAVFNNVTQPEEIAQGASYHFFLVSFQIQLIHTRARTHALTLSVSFFPSLPFSPFLSFTHTLYVYDFICDFSGGRQADVGGPHQQEWRQVGGSA